MHLRSLKDLYIHELRDLYAAERQLLGALPRLAEAAAHPKLREAFENHVTETRRQKARLEQLFARHGIKHDLQVAEPMDALLAEALELVSTLAELEPPVLDAALVAAAQRIEHLEIASYGTARAHANQLDLADDVRLLQESLDEESRTNELLNKLAISGINARAAC